MKRNRGRQNFLTILIIHPDKTIRQRLQDLYFENLRTNHAAYCCRLNATVEKSSSVEDAIKRFNDGLKVDVVIFSEDFPEGERGRVRELLYSLNMATPFRMIPLGAPLPTT